MEKITGINGLGPERQLIEGAAVPILDAERPHVFFGHIDDFGIGGLVEGEGQREGVGEKMNEVREQLRSVGLGVHKEQAGDGLISLGMLMDGRPQGARGNRDKIWATAECLWSLGSQGRAVPEMVENVLGLGSC